MKDIKVGERVFIGGSFVVEEIDINKHRTYVSGLTDDGHMVRVPIEYVEVLTASEIRLDVVGDGSV